MKETKTKRQPFPVTDLLQEAIEAINLKKAQLIQANPSLGNVSNAEAIARLILTDKKFDEIQIKKG